MDIIIGQECICPDGLGRVVRVIEGVAGSFEIRVKTYMYNRGCNWDSKNVELIDPRNHVTSCAYAPKRFG